MKFNVIESRDSDDFINKFIKLYYNRNLNKQQICEELDISGGKYLRIKRDLVDEGKIDADFRSRSNKGNAKYYMKNKKSNTFTVTRNINKKQLYFITVPTREMAEFAVNLFHRYGWRKQNIPFVRARLMEEFTMVEEC